VNLLSAQAERTFTRIIMKADDYGRLTGSPKLLRPLLYPLLLDQVRETDLERWIAECEKSGLVRLYDVEGKRYLYIPKFGQRMRADTSKFPEPPSDDGRLTDACMARDGPPRPYAESESESKANSTPDGVARQAERNGAKNPKKQSPQQILGDNYLAGWTHIYRTNAGKLVERDYIDLAHCIADCEGLEKAQDILRRFFQDRSKYVCDAKHPIALFRKNLRTWKATGPPRSASQLDGNKPVTIKT